MRVTKPDMEACNRIHTMRQPVPPMFHTPDQRVRIKYALIVGNTAAVAVSLFTLYMMPFDYVILAICAGTIVVTNLICGLVYVCIRAFGYAAVLNVALKLVWVPIFLQIIIVLSRRCDSPKKARSSPTVAPTNISVLAQVCTNQ